MDTAQIASLVLAAWLLLGEPLLGRLAASPAEPSANHTDDCASTTHRGNP